MILIQTYIYNSLKVISPFWHPWQANGDLLQQNQRKWLIQDRWPHTKHESNQATCWKTSINYKPSLNSRTHLIRSRDTHPPANLVCCPHGLAYGKKLMPPKASTSTELLGVARPWSWICSTTQRRQTRRSASTSILSCWTFTGASTRSRTVSFETLAIKIHEPIITIPSRLWRQTLPKSVGSFALMNFR